MVLGDNGMIGVVVLPPVAEDDSPKLGSVIDHYLMLEGHCALHPTSICCHILKMEY